MQKKFALTLSCLLALGLQTAGRAELSFGLNLSSSGADSFYLGVSNYYHVPQERVIYARDRSIPDDEIPVVFFLATRGNVGPDVIIQQRLGGMSWMDISLGLHLSPAIFYVPVSAHPGPPYGRAYGYYKKYPRSQWNKIRLPDADLVNMVNLRFVSEHYGYTAKEVMNFRGKGGKFHQVGKKGGGGGQGRSQGGGKAKGKGKGHGNGK